MDWNARHQESEKHASNAEIATHRGFPEHARQLYAKAAEAETQALLLVDPSKTRTYAITAVSAASLHFKAEQHGCARLVAKEAGRHPELPQFARQQLDDLEDKMKAAEGEMQETQGER